MRRTAVTVIVALVLGAAGLIASPFVLQWRSGEEAAGAQRQLRADLARTASEDPASAADATPHVAAAAPGQALAEVRIPRFGGAWSWVLVEGTTAAQLALGPGHYAGTPLPGQRGNVAVAAHRAGHGDPFLDFDALRSDDRVIFERGGTTWTYRLTSQPRIIPVSADWVLDPLPGRSLTLTTCWPRYGSSKRMYVRGELVDVHTTGAPSGTPSGAPSGARSQAGAQSP